MYQAISVKRMGDSVTPQTLFQAATISKPITAMAALHLVEQEKLSLDEDVNLRLTSWRVPENEYTRQQKITLRRILTHTAGTTVHGFLAYEVGRPIPTSVQILNGEKPATNEPIRVDFVPGTKQRYSGGGVSKAVVIIPTNSTWQRAASSWQFLSYAAALMDVPGHTGLSGRQTLVSASTIRWEGRSGHSSKPG